MRWTTRTETAELARTVLGGLCLAYTAYRAATLAVNSVAFPGLTGPTSQHGNAPACRC